MSLDVAVVIDADAQARSGPPMKGFGVHAAIGIGLAILEFDERGSRIGDVTDAFDERAFDVGHGDLLLRE